jgi:F0F1-type ATP synthase epsilon subunit
MVKRQDASTGQIVDDGKPDASANKPSDILQVKIYSPFKVYFDGAAKSISASNRTGQFDILPHHHNFITLLDAGDILVHTQSDEQKFHISGGLMHVKADQATVFLDV